MLGSGRRRVAPGRAAMREATIIKATITGAARRQAANAMPERLPWPGAALAIGSLSAGLWLGIFWLAGALL